MWLTSKRSLTSRATLVVVLMVNIHLATQDDVQQPSNLDILQAITNLQNDIETQITSQMTLLQNQLEGKLITLETEIFSEIQDLRKKMYSMENFCSETLHYKTALLENSGCSSWSSWGGCSATCGGGVKHRKRVCDAPAPTHGGLASLGEETLQDNCNPGPCPVHGGWSSWSSWEGCSATCGGGRQMSSRTCDNPPASNGGYQCAGDRTREENCNTQTCPIVCPEADGFILSAGGQQCLQVFMEQLSWEAAKALCMNKNLVLAKPQDPQELRRYLNGKYGDKFFYVHGRGTGSAAFQWRDGTLLDRSSSMWLSAWSSNSGYTSPDWCLALSTHTSYIRDYPAYPYDSTPCSYTYPFICEVLQE